MTFVWRQTACEMRLCCARRIDETGGRRKLGCTSTRLAERQRIIEAETNRIATLTAAAPHAGISIPEASRSFEPETANLSLSLGVPKGIFSFVKENIPFDSAARTPHFPSALCAESNRSPEGAQKRSSPFGLPLFYFSQMTGFWRSDSTKALAFSTASARGSFTCSPVRMSLQDTTPALISSSPRK